jgi:hypothetical protein
MSGNGGLKVIEGVPDQVRQLISDFHLASHDKVVNIGNTVDAAFMDGYTGAGANAAATTRGELQHFWDTQLEPILTALYSLVGGSADALADQDNLGAQETAAIDAGAGMLGKSGRLGGTAQA